MSRSTVAAEVLGCNDAALNIAAGPLDEFRGRKQQVLAAGNLEGAGGDVTSVDGPRRPTGRMYWGAATASLRVSSPPVRAGRCRCLPARPWS